jgi:guanidinobutyrase
VEEFTEMTSTHYQPLGGNEMPRFGGPATMMRLPAKENADGLDVCFVGVPLDIGTSNRPGASLQYGHSGSPF